MTQRYYRITGSEAFAAVQQYEADKNQLLRAAKAFAAHFGGMPVCSNDFGRIRFIGLRFRPEKPRDLWTAPDEQCGYVQHPRARLKSPINKALKEPHKALLAEWESRWDECLPNGELADGDPAINAIGYDKFYALICGDRFLMFSHEGAVWVTTQLELSISDKEEITGGQFDAARQAAEDSMNAKQQGAVA
ncbi:hypothetical protein LH435_09975 [Laribacter hongkongensis]|uniref:hypothetical protein n=1 Tax=Laribacter hongkongensis TaxID=168471 RepID=UPI001EFEE903|nr:hypothetical protein [Laribacter hongkongensis]MCG9074323.1 hypothetical protein [Laribacter hongkongensis]